MIARQSIAEESLLPIDRIVAAYLKAVEAGQPSDRQLLLARHAEIADDLAEFFSDLDQVEELAAPLRAVRQSTAGAAADTVDYLSETGSYLAGPRTPKPANRGESLATGDISGYEILGFLGRGGMGVVYQARHVALKRLVALKMMRAGDQADEAELARFRVEAEALARLQHPNIVQIYEVGDHRGQPFCALEFVGGGTLANHLNGTPQPPRESATLVRTLALAMEAAHQRGIVHRDLKPANILLSGEECGARSEQEMQGSEQASPLPLTTHHALLVPKITDFGLAKRLDEDAGQTRTGAVMGTPAYMAPEQALGYKEVGPLADVYALGVILYEMLTGRPPFREATMLETLEQVRTQEPMPVRQLQPKTPRDLETICLKCLEKDPRKRYASAAALAQDLEHWMDGRPIQARRSHTWERAYRWCRRNPLAASLAASVLIVFLAGFGGVLWQLGHTHAALGQAENSLYIQRITLAAHEAHADNIDRADVLLDLCPAALRHWEWRYLKRRCHAKWIRLAGHTDQVRCVAFNGDGTRLASCGNDGTARVWDTATGKELLTLGGHASWVNEVVLHADGRQLLSASASGTIKVWDAADGRELRSIAHGFVNLITFSPDGRLFAVMQRGELAVYELESGRKQAAIPGSLPSHGKAIAISRDGRHVAATLDACLRIWDARTGEKVQLLNKSMPWGALCMTFSPDGRRLFASQNVDRYPALKVWDATTGQELHESLSTPLTVSVIAISPDGRRIATGGHEGVVKVRDAATGKNLHAMRTFDAGVVALAFQPDGQGLAVAAGREVWLRAWGEQKNQGPRILDTGMVTSVAFSPDGSNLASCGDTEQVKVWDARTGKPVLMLTAPARGYRVVTFSADGRRLLATGQDGAAYAWDVAGGKPSLSLRVQGGELAEAVFSPNGRQIATAGSDRAVRVWDAASGQEVLTCHGHDAGVLSVAFSADGRRLASAGSDGTVRLWDAATGQAGLTLRGHVSHVQSVAFHPENQLLASASADETVRLWEVASGQEVAKLQGHTGPVRGLSFSPDGRRLASASSDGTVRLWDVATGQEALSLAAAGHVRWVAFSPDGHRLAMASSDGVVRIWDGTPLEN